MRYAAIIEGLAGGRCDEDANLACKPRVRWVSGDPSAIRGCCTTSSHTCGPSSATSTSIRTANPSTSVHSQIRDGYAHTTPTRTQPARSSRSAVTPVTVAHHDTARTQLYRPLPVVSRSGATWKLIWM